MLDNYIKKIEELILPEYYDRNNYKEKIILENNNNINDNNNNVNNNTSNTQQHNKIITSNIDSPILNSYHNSDINNNINITKPKQISSIKIEKLSSKNSKIENINNNNKNNNINKDKINNNKVNNENDNIINNNNIENERKEELNKMKQENSGKLQNPEFEIISNSNNNTNSNIQNNITIKSNTNNNNNNNFIKINDKIYTQNDLLNLLEKIKSINLKNMSYRYDMEKYKNKIIELNKINSEQKEEIEKLEKEKENLTQYLLKLEKLIRGQKSLSSNQSLHSNNSNTNSLILNTNKNKNFNVINNNYNNNNNNNINNKNKNIKEKETIEMKKSYNLFNQSNIDVSIGGNNPYVIITDVNTKVQTTLNNKKELKNFLIRINKENLKLKNFQNKVFELSKNYDDLNSNLEETINKFSDLLNNNINNDENNNDNINKAEFLENYKILCDQINKTLELKQNEYNMLLEGKDEALYLLQEELFITSNELEDRKRDRINEQKIINSLQIEINDLNEKLDNNNNNFISINSNNNKDDKNLNSLRTEIEAQKMTIPAKQVVNSIIKKIEKNFNMEDESNILLLNNINNSIK